LKDLIGDYSSREDKDPTSKFIFIQSLFSFMEFYFQSNFQADQQEAQQNKQTLDERICTEKICDGVFELVKSKISGTVPKESECFIIALACLTSPIVRNAYDRVESITGLIFI